MMPKSAGKMMLAGSSLVTLEKKYALTEYMPFECSRKNTALSSGTAKETRSIRTRDEEYLQMSMMF